MKAVAEFIWEWRWAQMTPERPGSDRYQDTLAIVAERNGLSPRTLERRHRELRHLVEPIVDAMWNAAGTGDAVIVSWDTPPDG